MIFLATTKVEADSGCKQVLEMVCIAGYYPVIVFCATLLSSVLTEELNRIESEGFKPVILRITDGSRLDVCSELEHKKHGISLPEELLPIIAPAEQLLDSEATRTSQCSISGLIPELSEWEIKSNGSIVVSLSSRVQWTVIEGQKLMGIDDCLTKPSETCQELGVVTDGLQAIVPAHHTVESDDSKQGFNVKDKLPPASPEYQGTTKNGPEQFIDEQAVISLESEICQEPEVVTDGLQRIVPAQHTAEPDDTKQGFNVKDKLPPSSPEYQATPKNGPEQFMEKQVATSSEASIQVEANLDLVQRPESVDNIENHAGHDASVDPLKENKRRLFFKSVNSLKHRFCSSLSIVFLWLGEILYFLGQKVGFRTGVLIFAIMGLGFPGTFQTSKNSPIASFEYKSINTQHFSLGTLRMANGTRLDMCSKSVLEKDGVMLPKNLSFSIPQQVVPAERFSWQHRKLNVKNPGTCRRAFSGIQWNRMEGQNLLRILAYNSEGPNISLPKPSKTYQGLQSDVVAQLSTTHTGRLNNTCDIKPGDYHLKAKVPASSQLKTKKEEAEQFVDKQADNSSQANFQGEVNGGLIQRSNNEVSHWCSKIKAYVSNAASGDKLEENVLQGVMNYVYSLKDNFWSLLSLLLPLMDVIFGFIGRKPSIIIGVTVSIVLGIAIPMLVLTSENCLPPNPFQYDFATLMYAIAHSLMFLSLVLQQTQRQWLSYRVAGAAYSCVILSILGHNFSRVPLTHACSGVCVLLVFVLFAVFCGNTPDRTD